jgi:hypothetical protein
MQSVLLLVSFVTVNFTVLVLITAQETAKKYPENPNFYRTRRLREEIEEHSWLSPWISRPCRQGITTTRRVTTQKISDLVYFAQEA